MLQVINYLIYLYISYYMYNSNRNKEIIQVSGSKDF